MTRRDSVDEQLTRLADALDDTELRGDRASVFQLRAQADRVLAREYGSFSRHLERLDAATVMSLLHPTARARTYVTAMALRARVAHGLGEVSLAVQLSARAFDLSAALLARDGLVVTDPVFLRALAAIAVAYVPSRWRALWQDMRLRVATQHVGYRA
ncbi:MAG: hypothetical protein B7733_01595 [Myxococcales bacterium FL481]|nr:MAG: hypothetical protein B7733_01595 [Myxococcales bacterium FL481]